MIESATHRMQEFRMSRIVRSAVLLGVIPNLAGCDALFIGTVYLTSGPPFPVIRSWAGDLGSGVPEAEMVRQRVLALHPFGTSFDEVFESLPGEQFGLVHSFDVQASREQGTITLVSSSTNGVCRFDLVIELQFESDLLTEVIVGRPLGVCL